MTGSLPRRLVNNCALPLLLHSGYFYVIKVMTYQAEEGSGRLLINTFQQAPDKSNNTAMDASKNPLNASAAPRAQRRTYLPFCENSAFFCSKRFVLWIGMETSFCSLTNWLALQPSLCSSQWHPTLMSSLTQGI